MISAISDRGIVNVCRLRPRCRSSVKGLPLHRDMGEHAYCWDTAHSLRFLQKLLDDDASEPSRGHGLIMNAFLALELASGP